MLRDSEDLLQAPVHDDELPVIVPQSCYSPCGPPKLPIELLCLIFQLLRPKFQRNHEELFRAITTYIQSLKRFSELRLLCTALNHIVTPIIHRELAIHLCSTSHPESISGAFELAAPYVRSVIIYGETHALEDTKLVVATGLGRCSQIQNLECYGLHDTFTNHGWIKLAPSLRLNLTSLTLCPAGRGSDLSNSLIALGSRLQRLEVLNWRRFPKGSVFHLPSEMPMLSELVLRGGCPEVEDLAKLVSRAVNKKAPKAQWSSLRSLSLFDVNIDAPGIMTVLATNNLCAQLTTLRVTFGLPRPLVHDFPVSLVKACPRLVHFSYMFLLNTGLLVHLPPSPVLEHLEIAPFPRASFLGQHNISEIPCLEDILAFIVSGSCPSLRILNILGGCPEHFGFACSNLGAACNKFGIDLSTINIKM